MRKALFGCLAVLLLPGISHAHTFAGGGGFFSGLVHPVLGFDHFLAMLSVGILSAQMGGRAIWTVPATFVAVMGVGGLLGGKGIGLPGVEYSIALSVLLLGLALALGKRLPPVWALLGVSFFAVFHGHAHGTEMPVLVEPLVYGLGFILGTASIHLAGVLVGVVSNRTPQGPELLRYVGAGITGIGVYIIHILLKY